ncbi:MAG: BON domain-containing protein [Steroidobacteraceae bacterium]
MKRDDMAIRHDVLSELDWDPRFDSRNIGVAVKNGVVALSGHVGSYAERRGAEEAAQSVAGVTAVANDIIIELAFEAGRTDAELAETAVSALKGNISVPSEHIKMVVRDGWITLDGEVAMWYQKSAAQNALANLLGVKGIINNISIRAFVSATEVKGKIQDAIRRRAQTDAQNIQVQAADGAVTLEGQVSSWAERQQAEMAAWQAPGVCKVIDNLSVRP